MEVIKSIFVGLLALLGLALFVLVGAMTLVAYPIIMFIITYAGLLVLLLIVAWIVGDFIRGV